MYFYCEACFHDLGVSNEVDAEQAMYEHIQQFHPVEWRNLSMGWWWKRIGPRRNRDRNILSDQVVSGDARSDARKIRGDLLSDQVEYDDRRSDARKILEDLSF
jgi:hypothetical protein